MTGVLAKMCRADLTRIAARRGLCRGLAASTAVFPASQAVFGEETTKTRKHQPETINSLQAFLAGLSLTHFASTHNPGITNDKLAAKSKIDQLSAAGKYDLLLQTLVGWTSQGSTVAWSDVLTRAELSHVLGLLVDHQIGLITKAAASQVVDQGAVGTRERFARANDARKQIRTLYGNMLGLHNHIYHKSNRSTLGNTALDLNAQDYENLIRLELSNSKLDLASKWFQRFEQQFPNGTHYRHMTYSLWLLKFEVYAGASPYLWKVEASELYEKSLNPRRSLLRSERLWLELFNDFVKHQHVMLGNQHFIFDKQFSTVLLYSVAYSRNVAQVEKLVELNWGIDKNGKMVRGFNKLARDDPLYPDIDTLRAVLVSMLYNKQFVPSMIYMNAFQEYYGLDLSKSKYFWEQLFRWSEQTTRFSELRALQHFVKETATTLVPTGDDLKVTLEEAQRSPDFDYEGYLQFVGDLKKQRFRLISELWKCYKESDPGFSPRVHRTYLSLLLEDPVELECFDFLSELSLQHHRHSLSAGAFNSSLPKDKLSTISHLYEGCMQALIDLKGTTGDLGQIAPLIDKWAMNNRMKMDLHNWALEKREHYLEVVNEKKNSMQEQSEEDEEFLGLMS